MPRRAISAEEDRQLINLLFEKDEKGEYKYGQRDIFAITGVSRIYLRKLAKVHGRQFSKTKDIVKPRFICANCGKENPRSLSRQSSKNQFCNKDCKKAFYNKPEIKEESVLKE